MKAAPKITVLAKDDKPYGLVLAADYVGEHECGIAPIQEALGCPIARDAEAQGLAARTMTQALAHIESLLLFETHAITETKLYADKNFIRRLPVRKTKITLLGFAGNGNPWKTATKHAPPGPRHLADQDFTAAWSDSDFLIAAWTEKAREIAALLAEGLRAGDFAAWIASAGSNPFARGGLVLARPSLTPEDAKAIMLEADREKSEIQRLADETGIKARLDARNGSGPARLTAEHRYLALSPRRIANPSEEATTHPVIFFLNPVRTDLAHCGWYTVEQLDSWLEGKGPIPKRSEISVVPQFEFLKFD